MTFSQQIKECNYPHQTIYGKMKPGIAPYSFTRYMFLSISWNGKRREEKNTGREKWIYVQPKGERKWRKKRSELWEMKQERKQGRKDEERHFVIKEKNEQIFQDMRECIPVLALIGSWMLDSGNLNVSLGDPKHLWKWTTTQKRKFLVI